MANPTIEDIRLWAAMNRAKPRQTSPMDIADWLATDPDAGKHFARVRSYQPPAVQQQMDEVVRQVDFTKAGGKLMPFSEPMTTKDVCDWYGFDEQGTDRAFQKLVDTTLTTGLQERMGTDAERPVPETTLRDQVEAAVDIHSATPVQE